MIISKSGYELHFVQTSKCKTEDCKLETYFFKFFSQSKFKYIVICEYYLNNVFAVKFYPSCNKHSEHKYNLATRKNDVVNVLVTVAKTVPYLLNIKTNASFCFCGARSIGITKPRSFIEDLNENQRYKIFKGFTEQIVGIETFQHIYYSKYSSYLLLNRNTFSNDIEMSVMERSIVSMFCNYYEAFPDILI